MAWAFDKAWGVMKGRDELSPEVRRLPGGDALVGPKDTEFSFNRHEDNVVNGEMPIEGIDEALDRAEQKERRRIMRRGISWRSSRPKTKKNKNRKRPDFKEYDESLKRASQIEKAWMVVKANESRPPTETHHDPHSNDAYIVSHNGVVDHKCEDCGEKSAVLIREAATDGGHLTAACDSCGYGGGTEMVDALIGEDPLKGDEI